MSLVRFMLERTVLFRVPGVKRINSIDNGQNKVTVFVGGEGGVSTPELLTQARQVLEERRPVTTLVEVKPYEEGPGSALPPYQLSPELRRSGVFWPPNKTDLVLCLKNCIPGCVHVDAVTVAGGVVDVYVGDESGIATQELVAHAKRLLAELFGPGVTFTVHDFTRSPAAARFNKRPEHLLATSRFDPALYDDEKIRQLARADEERFCDYLPELIEADLGYQTFLGRHFRSGGAVYPGLGYNEETLETLLALYETVYLPVEQDGEVWSQKRKLGLDVDLIVELARTGRVVPLFHAPLHQYNAHTVVKILEAAEGRALMPRELDGLTVLTLAKQFPFWTRFRQDPGTAAELYQVVRRGLSECADADPALEFAAEVAPKMLDLHLTVAEAGEVWFLDRGHTAAGTLAVGGTIESFVELMVQGSDEPKYQIPQMKDSLSLEAYGYSMNMAVARALGAVYAPLNVINEPILRLIAHLQAGPDKNPLTPDVGELQLVLRELHIARPSHVPLREYLEVLDSTEARRIRSIITDILNGCATPDSATELKHRIERYNQEVAKWRTSPWGRMADVVDLVGLGLDLALTATGLCLPGVSTFLGPLLKGITGGKVVDSLLGKLEDRVFGLIGGVSPAAIRIHKVRRELGKHY
ncbi:MAG TPA: hypothetical protein GXX50_07740 [Firmicutes bacterium]|nr:hypothetical protein [Bacillota bacterium]